MLRVVHRRPALDYVTGCVKPPRDWMAQGRELWEFNQFSSMLARPLARPFRGSQCSTNSTHPSIGWDSFSFDLV